MILFCGTKAMNISGVPDAQVAMLMKVNAYRPPLP